jgi:hypothetical protein
MFNQEQLLNDAQQYADLGSKVTLKQIPNKGIGLISTQNIAKGEIIAYYKITVFSRNKYISPTNEIYSFAIYRKNGEEYKRIIGDIDETSFPPPQNGITFWAPFANEPSVGQAINAQIDTNKNGNFFRLGRNYAQLGDDLIYNLVAIKDIPTGEEILWYYGGSYERDYQLGKIK